MWIAGVLLVAVAVAGFFYMRHTKSELHAMIGTETLSIPELEQLRKVSDELGAQGSFRKTAEVVGAAHPRPEGPLKAELSKTECVWYRYLVERQYETDEYRDGKRHRTKRTERVAEHTSWEGYALVDEQGRTIGIDPNGTSPDKPEQTVNRFEPHHGDGGVELFGITLPQIFSGGGSRTIGYTYKEWVIRPGRRLYILGEVHDKIGPLVIGKPEGDGHFLISTRTEQELREDRTRRHKMLAVGVVAGTVLGLGLVVADIVA